MVTRTRWWSALAIGLVVLSGCRDRGTRPPTDDAGAPSTTTAPSGSVDAASDLAQIHARIGAPGLAFVGFTRDRNVEVAAFGRLEGLAARPESRFQLASIAKLVTSVCVMQLVEQKRIDLDAEVVRYTAIPAHGATTRQLLAHTGSIHDRYDELDGMTSDASLDAFLRLVLLRSNAPRPEAFADARAGERYEYSNVGFALAALAVERVAQTPFRTLSRQTIFEPLAMPSARWPDDGGRGHGRAPYPASDLEASALDVARFGRAILRGGELDGRRILSEASVRAMLEASPDSGERALGWQIRTLDGVRVVGHEGEDRAASTALFLDTAGGAGAVVLTNGDAFRSGDRARAAAFEDLLVRVLAEARGVAISSSHAD